MMRPEWTSAKRVVIKIGSSLLIHPENGTLNTKWLTSLAKDLNDLSKQGKEVIVVSSGAIALGRKLLNLKAGNLKLEESQAAAAVGQVSLAHAYSDAFKAYGIPTAQILLTLDDTEQRRRYLNARSTISTLLKLNVIPVVNENDTVATTEIRYGDNDRLAARVGTMMSTDCVVLLSDIDGLYTASPIQNPSAQHMPEVSEINPDIEAMAGDVGTVYSKGGMITKIEAAKIAVSAGTHLVITTGKVLNPIQTWQNGGRATWFLSKGNPIKARKKWIKGTLEPKGKVFLDEGAVQALATGKSLLPAGVTHIEGTFERGDAVMICDNNSNILGQGLCAYSSGDANQIKGHKSHKIELLLGYCGRQELIHRDDMVLN
ncbi:MAG: glutamate 5-kinase [Pseudomonadota bacterium]